MLILFVRAMVLYAVIFVAMRVMGKRQLGELSASEFVIAMMISELASIPMQDTGIPLLYGVVPIATLVGLEFLSAFGSLKSLRFRTLISGRPSIVLREGKLDQRELSRNRLSVDELMEELRKKGQTDLAALRYVILEPGGQISAIPYEADAPATARELALHPKEKGLPLTIVSDGRIVDRNLQLRGLSREWLAKTLKTKGIASPKRVFLLTIDDAGEVFVEEKE